MRRRRLSHRRIEIRDKGASWQAPRSTPGASTWFWIFPPASTSLPQPTRRRIAHPLCLRVQRRARPGQCHPDFQISVAPASISLTPANREPWSRPSLRRIARSYVAMFVTLSCSACLTSRPATSPRDLEILPNATTPLTSSVVILTQQQRLHRPPRRQRRRTGNPASGAFASAAWPGRFAAALAPAPFAHCLLALVTTWAHRLQCALQLLQHGPPINPATPAGTYTVLVTAQSSNGVTVTTHSTDLAFT